VGPNEALHECSVAHRPCNSLQDKRLYPPPGRGPSPRLPLAWPTLTQENFSGVFRNRIAQSIRVDGRQHWPVCQRRSPFGLLGHAGGSELESIPGGVRPPAPHSGDEPSAASVSGTFHRFSAIRRASVSQRQWPLARGLALPTADERGVRPRKKIDPRRTIRSFNLRPPDGLGEHSAPKRPVGRVTLPQLTAGGGQAPEKQ
jgi:hypothetical protein